VKTSNLTYSRNVYRSLESIGILHLCLVFKTLERGLEIPIPPHAVGVRIYAVYSEQPLIMKGQTSVYADMITGSSLKGIAEMKGPFYFALWA
jgi:hypothetical protein